MPRKPNTTCSVCGAGLYRAPHVKKRYPNSYCAKCRKGSGKSKIKTNCCVCGTELERKRWFKERFPDSYCPRCKRTRFSGASKRSGETKYRNYIARWKQGLENGMRGKTATSAHIRRYLFEKYTSMCSKCQWGETNPYTKKVPLEINHIDGDFTNNNEENLELLCPNCHSLTKHFRSCNKGRGRPRK